MKKSEFKKDPHSKASTPNIDKKPKNAEKIRRKNRDLSDDNIEIKLKKTLKLFEELEKATKEAIVAEGETKDVVEDLKEDNKKKLKRRHKINEKRKGKRQRGEVDWKY
jgi:hypothetical protein